MARLTLQLSEEIVAGLEALVAEGRFATVEAAAIAGVEELVRHYRLSLLEGQQLTDIHWASELVRKRS